MKTYIIATVLTLMGSVSFAATRICSTVNQIGEGSGHYKIIDLPGHRTAKVEFFSSGGSVPQGEVQATSVFTSSYGIYFFEEFGNSRFIIVTADSTFNGGYDLLGEIPAAHRSQPLNSSTVERYGDKLMDLDCQ